MPYQPTYPYPYMDTIDVERNEGNVFKCLINSKDTVLDGCINIFKNSSQSDTLIYNGSSTGIYYNDKVPNNSFVKINLVTSVYNDLSERLKNNEVLIMYINSKYGQIREVNSSGSEIRIYFTEWISSLSNTSYDCSIYTNYVKKVPLSTDNLPFVGGVGDESWLTCVVDKEGLHNGLDYKWMLSLTFQDYKTITSDSVPNITNYNNTNKFVYIIYDETVYTTLEQGLKNNMLFNIIINSEQTKITSVLNVSDYIKIEFEELTFVPKSNDWFEIYSTTTKLNTPEYYFKARTTPEVDFDVPEKIKSSVYTFEANYSQRQKVGVAYFQYDLYSNGVLIDSSGQVFSQNISYTFENFVSGVPYSIKLTVVNDDRIEIEKEKKFNVEYELLASIINPIISLNNFKGYASVDFSNNAIIPSTLIGSQNVNYKVFGKPDYKIVSNGHLISTVSPTAFIIQHFDNILTGMYLKIKEELRKIIWLGTDTLGNTIVSIDKRFSIDISLGDEYEICSYYNGIHLNAEQAILWDNISGNQLVLPEKSTQVVHWHASHGFNGLVLEKVDFDNPEKSIFVYYNDGMFLYKIGSKRLVYNPYVGRASAIAGKDERSDKGTIIEHSSNSVVLENSPLISVGKVIQVGTESRIIKSATVSQGNVTVVLDRAFSDSLFNSTDTYVVYDENYLYVLDDDDNLQDTDILIDNDLTNKYWWLIVVLPDEVQFIKTTSFTEGEV